MMSTPDPDKIILNAFVRRTANTDTLKTLIKATGAKLGRKGRSRHWLLLANPEQQRQIIDQLYQADESSWLWLAKQLGDNRPATTFSQLLDIVRSNPAITVSQLVGQTDCTIGEARAALDEVEWGG